MISSLPFVRFDLVCATSRHDQYSAGLAEMVGGRLFSHVDLYSEY